MSGTDPHPALAGFPVVIELPVCWGEMDSYGHVNSVVYFRYFESAHLEYFGLLDWRAIERETGIGPILAATQTRFHWPLTYPDKVWVAARVSSLKKESFTFEHVVFSRAQNAVAAEGDGRVMAYHYGRQKKVSLPEEIRRRIKALEGPRSREPPV
jgi:acyl-CoA thioester hydrolase